MKRVFFTGPVVKVLAACGMIAGIGLIVFLMSGMPRPRERDRITTPAGEFSIIKPPDWIAAPAYSSETSEYIVSISCESTKSVGVGPRMIVSRLRQPQNVDHLKARGMLPLEFQSKPAMAMGKSLKRDFFYTLIFERDDEWYEIILRLPKAEDVPSTGWWEYLSSFRRGASATHPATP